MAVAMAMLPPPPKTCPDSVVSAGKEKNIRVPKATYCIGIGVSYELQEDRAYDCGCNSGSSLRDSVGSFKKKNSSAFGTVYYLNEDNPVSNCPNSYISLHARRPSIQ